LEFVELSHIKFARKCKGPGIFVPEFYLTSDSGGGLTVAQKGLPTTDHYLNERAEVPDDGITHTIVHYDGTYVTEFGLISNTHTFFITSREKAPETLG
jgi:hypothetical protein